VIRGFFSSFLHLHACLFLALESCRLHNNRISFASICQLIYQTGDLTIFYLFAPYMEIVWHETSYIGQKLSSVGRVVMVGNTGDTDSGNFKKKFFRWYTQPCSLFFPSKTKESNLICHPYDVYCHAKIP